MLMKRVERVYLSDVDLHIVLASISKRIITDILPLGYILSSTYICQIYLSYVCHYLLYPVGIVIVNLTFEYRLFSYQVNF